MEKSFFWDTEQEDIQHGRRGRPGPFIQDMDSPEVT